MVRALLLLFAVGTAVELVAPDVAEARAGRSRSMGRSSRPASGYQQQPHQQQQPGLGAPQGAGQQMGAAGRGGFMRGLAGGIAGGFLGSMLFGSLAQGAGLGGGAGGGIGFLEIVIFAGIAFLLFRWWRNRQQQQMQPVGVYGGAQRSVMAQPTADSGMGLSGLGGFRALAPEGIESDEASDVFFRIQGAWTRRDLSSVHDLLDPEMHAALRRDVDELRAAGRINRLENISVRRTEVLRTWREDALELSTVRFTANLLDYTVDEATGRVLEGSDSEPVKFEEDWTFAREPGGAARWRLAGIEQV